MGPTLIGAGEHDSTAFGPVELAVVDRAVIVAGDEQVLGKAHRE
jgi:hypothetical protein